MNRPLAAVCLALASLASTACNRTEPTASRGQPSAIYTVRGIVEALPNPEKRTPLEVRHEAIDNFVDSTGAVVGMHAMVMPFPLAEGVSLEGIEPGDKVELTFAVWWEPKGHWEATKIVELPPDTPLTFRRANPPGAAGEATPSEPPASGG